MSDEMIGIDVWSDKGRAVMGTELIQSAIQTVHALGFVPVIVQKDGSLFTKLIPVHVWDKDKMTAHAYTVQNSAMNLLHMAKHKDPRSDN